MKYLSFILLFISLNVNAESFREKIRAKIAEKLAAREMKKDPPQVSEVNEAKLAKAGSYTFKIKVDNLERFYKLYIPKKMIFTEKSPIIFAFHGGGGDMNQISEEKNYHLLSKSEELGIPIVFPNGYSLFPTGRIATWNAGKCCGDARDKNIDDVKFIREVFTDVKSKLSIRDEEVYAIGMSNGGMMAYRLACEASDIFKKIMAVAGTDNTVTCPNNTAVSILHIHAKDDDHVLFMGGHGKAFSDKRIEKVTEFTSVAATMEKWMKHNQCTDKKVRVLDNKDVYCDLFSECRDQTKIKLCVTASGGHSWPGSSKGKSSNAISANDLMWQFFRENQ